MVKMQAIYLLSGEKDDVIGEYFNENGIITKETKGFSDL